MDNIDQNKEKLAGLRDILTPPDQTHTLLCALLFLLSCFVLPTSDVPNLCTMYVLGCVVFYYMLTRSVRGLIIYAVPVFLLYTAAQLFPWLPTPLLLPACFLSLTVGGSCGAFLLTHAGGVKQLLPLAALPVVAWGAVFLVTGDPLRGLLVLIPTAVAVVSALCLLKLTPRTPATLTLAATLAAALAVGGVITLAAMGTLSTGSLSALADGLRNGVIAMYRESVDLYAEYGISLGLSATDINNTAILIVNVLPGAFLAVCGVTAFMIWRTLLQMLLAFRSLPRLPLRLSGFTVSRMCAIVFLAVALLGVAESNDALLGT